MLARSALCRRNCRVSVTWALSFQIYQSWLDKSTPYTAVRWVVTLGLSFIYMIRVYLLPGWYIVTYALGIHHLNLLIAFLSPEVDPSLMEDSDDGPSLPTKQNEEFQSSI